MPNAFIENLSPAAALDGDLSSWGS